MTKWMLSAGLLLATLMRVIPAGAANTVAVVYNKNLPESKKLAEYYAERRGVPAGQIFGVEVNAASEVMSRAEFRDQLEKPIFDWLVAEKLFTPNAQKKAGGTNAALPSLSAAKIRYLVLCHGIPLKIARDGSIKEAQAEKLPETLRDRNEAAVDADLALLPVSQNRQLPLTGLLGNPFYGATNSTLLDPTNGILMVARLDGPTVDIARGLVDKALQAETNGLWGRAYFDARGITNGEYKLGDDWIRASAVIARRLGFETVLDETEPLFPASFPMSQIAIYAGWYDGNVSGPFAQPLVEFMPGAFAYHLHSYSAVTLRSTNLGWTGPLLAKGATITMGTVDEPYLAGTPNVAMFLDRLIYRRFTFGEAAYACQGSLSWQTTVVGDPLYCPFAQRPDVLHRKLEAEFNPLVEWSHLRVIDLNEASGMGARELIQYIEQIPFAKNSSVLQEKLGDLQRANQKLSAASEAYALALKRKTSAQQRIRLLLNLAEIKTQLGRDQEALDAYEQLITDAPGYPGAPGIYQKLAALARKLGKTNEAERFAKKAEPPAAPK